MCVSKIRCEEEEKNPASFNKFRFNPDIEKLHNGLVTKLALSLAEIMIFMKDISL